MDGLAALLIARRDPAQGAHLRTWIEGRIAFVSAAHSLQLNQS
jgi:hypothetical protein